MKISYSDLWDMVEDPRELPEVDEMTKARIRKQVMAQIEPAKSEKKHRRGPRLAMITVAAMLVLSITAGAAYMISHEKTKALIETNPYQGHTAESITVDERSYEVIDTTSRDYGLVSQDRGTTVTLDSIMGSYSDHLSVAYLTLTITPAEGTEITADVSDLGFCGYAMPMYEKDGMTRGADGSSTVIRNEDGSYSVMLLAFYDENVNGQEMTLTLEGFGNVSKEHVKELADGAELVVPGQWSFEFEMQLDEANKLILDENLFTESDIAVSEVTMSSFGGTMVVSGYQSLLEEKYLALAKEAYGDLELDWNQVSLQDPTYLENLYAEGALTLEDLQGLLSLGDAGVNYLAVSLEYADGTVYEANTSLGAEPMEHVLRGSDGAESAELFAEEGLETAAGNYEDVMLMPFLFNAPQSISDAKYLIIEGVKIPLN